MSASLWASLKASASDLGQRYCDTTNYAVAVGLDYTMEKTRSALAAVGVTEVSARAVQLADAAVAASGVVSYTRAAVDATGRAIEASGALSAVSRVTEASAEALSASMDATVHAVDRAVDLTVTSTRKAVEYSARAAEVLPGAVDLASLTEELKDLTHESNERILAALYPGWNGDNSGSAALLASLEASWAAVAARQAHQLAAAAAAEDAAAHVDMQLRERADAWARLHEEAAHLPELLRQVKAITAGCAATLAACDTLSASIDCAEAGSVAAYLRIRGAAEERAAASAEAQHAQALESLNAQRRAWAHNAAAALKQLPHESRMAAAQLQRRLQEQREAHGARRAARGDGGSLLQDVRTALGATPPTLASKSLADVEVDLGEATKKLKQFLEGGPTPSPGGAVPTESPELGGGYTYQGYQDPAAVGSPGTADSSFDGGAGAVVVVEEEEEEEDTRVPGTTQQGALTGDSTSDSD